MINFLTKNAEISTFFLLFWLFIPIIPMIIVYLIEILIRESRNSNFLVPSNKNFKFVVIIWVLSWVWMCIPSKRSDNIDFQGYVFAFPNEDNVKNYYVKADMHYSSEDGYTVKRIYFNNGGWVDIDNEFENDEPLNSKGEMSCNGSYDKQGRDWCFKFYGEQIKEK